MSKVKDYTQLEIRDLIAKIDSEDRVKVVCCYCGEKIVMACAMPYAEIDDDVIKDFQKYAKEGRRIEYRNHGNWEWCEKKCQPKNSQLNLFE